MSLLFPEESALPSGLLSITEASMSTQWEAELHPRDRVGKFAAKLGQIRHGDSIHLPHGVSVHKRGGLLGSAFDVQHRGGAQRVRDPEAAARAAFGHFEREHRSAQVEIGGPHFLARYSPGGRQEGELARPGRAGTRMEELTDQQKRLKRAGVDFPREPSRAERNKAFWDEIYGGSRRASPGGRREPTPGAVPVSTPMEVQDTARVLRNLGYEHEARHVESHGELRHDNLIDIHLDEIASTLRSSGLQHHRIAGALENELGQRNARDRAAELLGRRSRARASLMGDGPLPHESEHPSFASYLREKDVPDLRAILDTNVVNKAAGYDRDKRIGKLRDHQIAMAKAELERRGEGIHNIHAGQASPGDILRSHSTHPTQWMRIARREGGRVGLREVGGAGRETEVPAETRLYRPSGGHPDFSAGSGPAGRGRGSAKAQALVDAGLADDLADARAQLADMGETGGMPSPGGEPRGLRSRYAGAGQAAAVAAARARRESSAEYRAGGVTPGGPTPDEMRARLARRARLDAQLSKQAAADREHEQVMGNIDAAVRGGNLPEEHAQRAREQTDRIRFHQYLAARSDAQPHTLRKIAKYAETGGGRSYGGGLADFGPTDLAAAIPLAASSEARDMLRRTIDLHSNERTVPADLRGMAGAPESMRGAGGSLEGSDFDLLMRHYEGHYGQPDLAAEIVSAYDPAEISRQVSMLGLRNAPGGGAAGVTADESRHLVKLRQWVESAQRAGHAGSTAVYSLLAGPSHIEPSGTYKVPEDSGLIAVRIPAGDLGGNFSEAMLAAIRDAKRQRRERYARAG